VDDQGIRERIFVGLQHLLPQHLLSRLARSLSQARSAWLRTALIRGFLRLYPVNLGEAEYDDPSAYDSFSHFFTRRLRTGARKVDQAPQAVTCPVDGYVSEAGRIVGDSILQAKGISYTATRLLGNDGALAAQFAGGTFATFYLAPHNYHRVHMPLAGTLRLARLVPGDLFSVNAATAASVPGLFTRNERIACVFDTAAGPMAVVLVGALFVGSIGLSWTGEVRAPRTAVMHDLPSPNPPPALDKGAELGWFNMGSTVILLFAGGDPVLAPGLSPGRAVWMGECIATLR
jgi:phosphatidylserine decarboxylase